MSLHAFMCTVWETLVASRGCQNPWNRSYPCLWAARWVLGTELVSSGRATGMPNHWAISPVSLLLPFLGLDSMCTGHLTTRELKSLSWDFGLYLAKHISHHYHVTCPPWSLPGTFLRPGTSLILALLATNRVSMLIPTCYRAPPAGGYETALFYSVYFML